MECYSRISKFSVKKVCTMPPAETPRQSDSDAQRTAPPKPHLFMARKKKKGRATKKRKGKKRPRAAVGGVGGFGIELDLRSPGQGPRTVTIHAAGGGPGRNPSTVTIACDGGGNIILGGSELGKGGGPRASPNIRISQARVGGATGRRGGTGGKGAAARGGNQRTATEIAIHKMQDDLRIILDNMGSGRGGAAPRSPSSRMGNRQPYLGPYIVSGRTSVGFTRAGGKRPSTGGAKGKGGKRRKSAKPPWHYKKNKRGRKPRVSKLPGKRAGVGAKKKGAGVGAKKKGGGVGAKKKGGGGGGEGGKGGGPKKKGGGGAKKGGKNQEGSKEKKGSSSSDSKDKMASTPLEPNSKASGGKKSSSKSSGKGSKESADRKEGNGKGKGKGAGKGKGGGKGGKGAGKGGKGAGKGGKGGGKGASGKVGKAGKGKGKGKGKKGSVPKATKFGRKGGIISIHESDHLDVRRHIRGTESQIKNSLKLIDGTTIGGGAKATTAQSAPGSASKPGKAKLRSSMPTSKKLMYPTISRLNTDQIKPGVRPTENQTVPAQNKLRFQSGGTGSEPPAPPASAPQAKAKPAPNAMLTRPAKNKLNFLERFKPHENFALKLAGHKHKGRKTKTRKARIPPKK